MTIVVECILESAVFFPGDTVFCRIYISNKSLVPYYHNHNQPLHHTDSSNSINQKEREQNSISWITAQLYGNLMVESSYIQLSSTRGNKKKGKEKSLKEGGGSGGNTPSKTSPSTGGNNSTSPSSTATTTNNNNTSSQHQQSSNITTKSLHVNANSMKKYTAGGVSSATSLPNMNEIGGENGKSIFASPTTFLASDLYIPPGQTRSYIYYVTLPSPLPPSFKGTSLKYSYFLSIAVQVYTNPAQILTVPIRVLTPASALGVIKFKSNMNFDFEEGSAETTQENQKSSLEVISKWPISPFKKSQYFPVPYPQTISQYDSNNTRKSVIDLLNKHSTPVTTIISKGTDKLAIFSICKTAFNLGDSVYGTFDFSIAMIPCYKILVKLECEEIVDPKYLQHSRGSHSKPIRKLFGELHEYTTNIRQTHFTFHIPVEASQEFSTKYVSVKWSLRFEFVTPLKSSSSFMPYQPPPPPLQQQPNVPQQPPPPTITTSTSSPSSQPNTPPITPSKSVDDLTKQQSHLSPRPSSLPKNSSFSGEDQHPHQHHHQHHRRSSNNNNNNSSDNDNDNNSSHSEHTNIDDETMSNSSSSTFSTSTGRLHGSSSSSIQMVTATGISSSGSIQPPQQHQQNQTHHHQHQTTTSTSTSNTNQQTQPPTRKRMSANPNIGILKDDGSVPLVDTLHWSLPIRVLVSSPPHELLHTNKNELYL